MSKKLVNFIIIIIVCVSMNLFCYQIYGASTVDDVVEGAQDFISKGHEVTFKGAELKDTSEFIYNLLLAIAMVTAVIIGSILGVQFILASVEEKAKIKESLIPYVVGCVVVFGAFGIWKITIIVLSTW